MPTYRHTDLKQNVPIFLCVGEYCNSQMSKVLFKWPCSIPEKNARNTTNIEVKDDSVVIFDPGPLKSQNVNVVGAILELKFYIAGLTMGLGRPVRRG